MDTEREKEIGLAPKFPFEALGPGECVMHSLAGITYGLEVGSNLTISMIFA